MTGFGEIKVIFQAETARTLKSVRAPILVVLYGLFSVALLLTVSQISQAAQAGIEAQGQQAGADTEQVVAAQAEMKKGVVGALFGDDPTMVEALVEVPLVLLVVFKLTFFFLPFYIALMGFDQVSGEVGPKSIRYLAIRASRSAILFGKFLAQCAILIGLVLLVDLGIFAYAKVANPDFGWRALLPTLIKFWLAAVLYALAFLAVTNFFSTAFRTPWASLLVNLSALIGLLFFHAVVSVFDSLRPLLYVSPFHYLNGLLHPQLSHFGASGAFYAAMALLFLGGSYGVLRARDL